MDEVGDRPEGTESFPKGAETVPIAACDLLRIGSLSLALTRLVLRSEQLEPLRKEARAFAAERNLDFEDDAGLINPCYGSDEPVLPLSYFKELEWSENLLIDSDFEFQGPEDPEVERYFAGEEERTIIDEFYDALNFRARTFFELLQRKEVVAWGMMLNGETVHILQTIWARPDFYIHPPTGDIFDGNTYPMTKRWMAVTLCPPGKNTLTNRIL